MKSNSELYKQAGVDINAGYKAVELMKASVARTMIKGADCDIGGFGGLFMPDMADIKTPVLVSGTDGVGTKLKLAFLLNKHDTIGIDCVAMCANDVLCCGAKPMFFLDYIAVGKNVPERVAEVVAGVAEGCVQSACALIGGETAEMPGFYKEDEYDLAGFCVGIVDKDKILNKESIAEGDVLIGLTSSGLHSNGFSLARKVFDVDNADLNVKLEELNGKSLGEALIEPTKIYVKPVTELFKKVNVKGLAHITGGGFYENIPRVLPENLSAKIYKDSWEIPALFKLLAKTGNVPEVEMFSTFNMGVGMVAVVNKNDSELTIKTLKENGQDAFVLGEIVKGSKEVIL